MTIYNRFTDTRMELYVIAIWSLVVNQIIATFYSMLHDVIFTKIYFTDPVKIAVYTITAIIAAYAAIKIRKSMFVRKWLSKSIHKTLNQNSINDVIDYSGQTMMAVYLKDSNLYYAGTFKLKDEKDGDFYIVLTHYCAIDKNTNDIINNRDKERMAVMINTRNIERIEVSYSKDSEVWKWLNK